jgi:hypothetical protein
MRLTALTTTELTAIIAVIVIVVVGIAVFFLRRKRRTEKLRGKFGDAEYARALKEHGDRRQAEAELESARNEWKVSRPATSGRRSTRLVDAWRGIQTRFVDDPAGAVVQADPNYLGDGDVHAWLSEWAICNSARPIFRGPSAVLRELSHRSRKSRFAKRKGRPTQEDLRQADPLSGSF